VTPQERMNAEQSAQRDEIVNGAAQQAAKPVHGLGFNKSAPQVKVMSDTTQTDLAASRAAITADQTRRAGGIKFERAKDLSFEESGAQVRAGQADARVPGMLYEPDKETKSQPHQAAQAKDYRRVRAICPACSATFTLAQSMPHGSEEWTPDTRRTLEISGWQFDADAGEWVCGKWCLEQQLGKRKMHSNMALPVVGSLPLRGSVKALYATAAPLPPAPAQMAAPVAQDETTPAAPPVIHAPAGPAAHHKGQPNRR
jgi:hypothetical protein